MKKYLIISCMVIAGLSILLIIRYLETSKTETVNQDEEVTYQTAPIEEQTLVYIGDEDADNELLFVFDYSCPWCKVWLEEVYPELEDEYIQEGTLKFRTQAMVYLNEASLLLSNFDQNLKNHLPDQYEALFNQVVADVDFEQEKQTDWGTTSYIETLIDDYQLDRELLLQEPEIDAISVTRKYTRELEIDGVPTVFVNGVRIDDLFDIDAITAEIK
ncbi:thioredoxin domain-containing protein [Amphibacillus cookii]|uniref:thioredoxin domain-containing protein n=1 Tax=Amphibacillus cookii TaxID=767787 RepID=UPI001958416B|nr:protein-disulfide isomerase [Amphibacillus cookii]